MSIRHLNTWSLEERLGLILKFEKCLYLVHLVTYVKICELMRLCAETLESSKAQLRISEVVSCQLEIDKMWPNCRSQGSINELNAT